MKLKRPVLTVALAGLLFFVAVIAIWRISIGSANNSRLRAIAARGEPVDLTALDKFYAAVPDSSNAALIWLQAVASISEETNGSLNKVSFKWSVPLTDEELEAGATVLSSNKEALALFRTAAALPQSRYPVNLSQIPFTNFHHWSSIKTAAQLLRMEAGVAAQQGDEDRAVDAIRCIFAAGNSIATEPLLISQLVRYAVDVIGVQSAEFALNRTSFGDLELQTMQLAAANADKHGSLRLALLGERASIITVLRNPQAILAGDPTFSPSGAEAAMAETFAFPLMRAIGFWQRDLRFGIDALTTNVLFAGLPDPQRFQSATNSEAIADRARSGYYVMTSLLLPALQKAFVRDALHTAQIRNAVVALAVERFKVANNDSSPADGTALTPVYLEKLPVDPFDGKPVRYKRTGRGYIVYCVGPDATDDGGLERPPKYNDKDPWDVTFIVERK
jgi:hypothetical protein